MATTALHDTPTHGVAAALHRARSEPAYGAYLLMRIGFTVPRRKAPTSSTWAA